MTSPADSVSLVDRLVSLGAAPGLQAMLWDAARSRTGPVGGKAIEDLNCIDYDQLIDGVIDEDPESLSLLYDVCKWVIGRNKSRIPPFVNYDVDDFVHDIYILLFQNECALLKGLRQRSKLPWYILAIFRSQLSRRSKRSLDPLTIRLEGPALATFGTRENRENHREMVIAARRILQGLKEIQKRAYFLWLEGFTQEEIASELGVARGTVASTISRVNSRLRRDLARGRQG